MRKEQLDIRDRRRHVRFFNFFRPIMARIFGHKFNYTYDDLSDIEGPYLLLANHNTNYDPILVGIAAHRQLYFVASEHIMQKGFVSKLLDYFLHPIIHLKGKAGVNTISDMLRSLKSGYSVAIFPEGNRSFNGLTCDFLPTIGRLARKSGAKLVTFRFEGGYFTQPRWSFTLRKGQLRGHLVRVYDVDELKGMTDDEVNASIVRDLSEDAYAVQSRERIPFRGRKLAYGLETTLFACPKCQKIGTLHSTDSHLKCSCGYDAEYDVYGDLVGSDGTQTVTTIDAQQRSLLAELVSSAGPSDLLFEDTVTAIQKGEKHRASQTVTGCLRAFRDRVEFNGHVLYPANLIGMAIHSRNTIVAHLAPDGTQYEVKGCSTTFCALKYLYLYELATQET